MKKIDIPLKNALKEFLEPYGFKKVRGRYPYFVKVINDEIIQVITFRNLIGMGYITIVGVATVYGGEIDFSISPKDNGNWLDNYDIGIYKRLKFDNEKFIDIPETKYPLIEPDIEEKDFQQAIEYTISIVQNLLLPVLARVTDLPSCVSFYQQFSRSELSLYSEIKDISEGLLNFLVFKNVEEYQKNRMMLYDKGKMEMLKEMELGYLPYTQEDYERAVIEKLEYTQEQIRLFTEQRTSPEILAEIEYRKNLNIQSLREQKVI